MVYLQYWLICTPLCSDCLFLCLIIQYTFTDRLHAGYCARQDVITEINQIEIKPLRSL